MSDEAWQPGQPWTPNDRPGEPTAPWTPNAPPASEPAASSEAPPAYGAPSYGAPSYGAPSYQAPSYQAPPPYQAPSYQAPSSSYQPSPYQPPEQPSWSQNPAPGDLQWSQGPGGSGPSGWDQLSSGPPVPPKRSRTRLLIGALVAVVVVGGGAATYVAVSDNGDSAGAGSPQAAVTSVVSDLNNSDLLGVLDHLAPGERRALVDPLTEQIKELKRLGVGTSSSLNHVQGVTVNASGLGFAGEDVVNDHETVVLVNAGVIQYNVDLTRLSTTGGFLGNLGAPAQSVTRASKGTLDLAARTRDTGKPIRIATVKVGGKWYPSLLYTVADTVAQGSGTGNPTAADAIPAKGGSSAQDAVTQFVEALAKGDYRRAIELSSPDELGVLHDYGNLLLKNLPTDSSPAGFTITNLSTGSVSVTGGTRVTLKSVTVQTGGDTVTVAFTNNCLSVTTGGRAKTYCANDLIAMADSSLQDAGKTPLTDEEKAALARAVSTLPNLGVISTEQGGSWYVNPIRSLISLPLPIYQGLQGNDLKILLKAVSSRR